MSYRITARDTISGSIREEVTCQCEHEANEQTEAMRARWIHSIVECNEVHEGDWRVVYGEKGNEQGHIEVVDSIENAIARLENVRVAYGDYCWTRVEFSTDGYNWQEYES